MICGWLAVGVENDVVVLLVVNRLILLRESVVHVILRNGIWMSENVNGIWLVENILFVIENILLTIQNILLTIQNNLLTIQNILLTIQNILLTIQNISSIIMIQTILFITDILSILMWNISFTSLMTQLPHTLLLPPLLLLALPLLLLPHHLLLLLLLSLMHHQHLVHPAHRLARLRYQHVVEQRVQNLRLQTRRNVCLLSSPELLHDAPHRRRRVVCLQRPLS